MKHKLTTILMMQGFVKIASLKKSVLAATIMLAAVFAAQAATYTVTNADDSGAGSLRDAINQANASIDNDTINFTSSLAGQTITLTSALPAIANNGTLSITGNGATNTIISGNNAVTPLTVNGGANVTLNGLTVTNGNSPGGTGGGALNFGTLTVTGSTFSGNTVGGGSGGAIANFGTLTLTGSTLSGNSAGRGGAIYLQDATATLTNTTISGNTASFGAGAITNLSGGGGAGSLTLNSCTVTGNTGVTTGGVSAFDNGGSTNVTTTLKNTIVANNSNPQLFQSGANANLVSQGYNLTSDNGSGLLTGIGDQINTNPLLGPLADNGGPTLTHSPLCGSPAIDGGQNSNDLTSDQRGAGFARTVNLAAANVDDGTDIGAVELQSEPDCTAPVITPNVSGTLGDNGWHTSDVQVSWSVSDDESSVSSQTGCDTQTVTTDTNGVTFTCSATSAGGTASNSVTIKRDTTNPVISFVSRTAANANGWNNASVMVNWSCSDTLSGAVNASISQTVSTEGLNQSSIGTCQDSAGNTASNTQTGINIDKTAPTLAPTVSPNPVLLNGTATATPNATDALSGIAAQSCGAVNTTSVGFKTVACTATDLAGNTANANANYQVVYNFAGFFQPVENLPTINIVNAGQSIPIKFSLSGYQGLNIVAAGYPISTPVACDASEPGSTINQTVNAGGSSLSYNATTDQYSYVWRTENAWRGTCRMFVLKLTDGSEHYAKFRFR